MSDENFDLEAWLNGANRTERAVTVYGRGDLLADIDMLEKERRTVAAIPAEDRSMGDGGSQIQARIDALMIELDASKLELRVTFLDDDERNAIQDLVKAEYKAEADAAAKKAAVEARESCRRSEITAVNDINQVVRRMTAQAANAVIEREIGFHAIAAAVIHSPMSVEHVRKLYKKIGDSQLELIRQAFTRASVEAPEVQVPKSLAPSPSDDGATSS